MPKHIFEIQSYKASDTHHSWHMLRGCCYNQVLVQQSALILTMQSQIYHQFYALIPEIR